MEDVTKIESDHAITGWLSMVCFFSTHRQK
jgi:hypothetical protein